MEYKVIVTVNSNEKEISVTDKYNRLFAKAYQALEKVPGKLTVTHDDKMFHSIDEYFAHLADLYELDPTYIMLPLDETPFTIDANKRTITNPKITVLQKDQNAEIVTFVIDRYFDYKDLSTAQYTYVQWTLPDGTEGASNITLKDFSIPGKLRLGWPLDNEITSQKGAVKFSLRFFDMGTITDAHGKTKEAVVYSFNTLTSTLTINESLQPEVDPDGLSVNDPVNEGLFRKAIVNSQLRTENQAIPLGPRFDDPGLNLNQYESLTVTDDYPNGTLTMMAQALASDSGTIDYQWWYKPAEDNDTFNSDTWYPYEQDYVLASKYVEGLTYYTKNISGEYSTATVTEDTFSADKHYIVLPGFNTYGGQVNDDVYESFVYNGSNIHPGEKYYSDNAGTAATDEDFIEGNTLYERFTTYTVPIAGPVTGQYKVRATNTIGANKSKYQDSKVCFLVSPDDITFQKGGDLKPSEIFAQDANGADLSKKLTVTPSVDTTLNAVRTFTWSRYIEEPEYNEDKELTTEPYGDPVIKPAASGEGENIVYGNVHEITEPGWYQVIVDSSLNREVKSAASTMCKVTSKPVAPARRVTKPSSWDDEEDGVWTPPAQVLIMEYGSNASDKVDSEGIAYFNVSAGDIVTLDISTILTPPDGLDDKLFSDALSFEWGYQSADTSFRYLNDKDVGPDKLIDEGLGTSTLKVRAPADIASGDKIYTFKCVITNNLNGQKAACTLADALAFKVT